jgi:hypothetical protein
VTVNAPEINAALGVVQAAFPLAMTAYNILAGIWLKTNPGKTIADYEAYLTQWAQANVDDSAAILRADGYVEGPPGTWTKAGALPAAKPPVTGAM